MDQFHTHTVYTYVGLYVKLKVIDDNFINCITHGNSPHYDYSTNVSTYVHTYEDTRMEKYHMLRICICSYVCITCDK